MGSRVCTVVAALLMAIFGMPSAATAVVPPTSAAAAYTYDDHPPATVSTGAVSERGPLAMYDHSITVHAVDHGSHGASAHPAAPTTLPIITYDHPGLLVQVAAVATSTQVAGSGEVGAVSPFQRPSVATNGAGDGAETFYRTMSKESFAELQSTGRVPATSGTFISPSAEFSSADEGQMVEFSVRPGTTSSLAGVGVRDGSAATRAAFPNTSGVSSGWTSSSAYFKGEDQIINIGLGRGPALDIFNDAILEFCGVG